MSGLPAALKTIDCLDDGVLGRISGISREFRNEFPNRGYAILQVMFLAVCGTARENRRGLPPSRS